MAETAQFCECAHFRANLNHNLLAPATAADLYPRYHDHGDHPGD